MIIEDYFSPEAIQINRMLGKARRLKPREAIQIRNIPEERFSAFYQAVYDNVLIHLEDVGEFEQCPLFQGLQIRRTR